MLVLFNDLQHRPIQAKNGAIGEVNDLYVEDRYWSVKYVVVDTSRWLPGRKVLLSPSSLFISGPADKPEISSHLTLQQIEESPSVSVDLPVSLQNEESLANYYGMTAFWATPDPVHYGFPYPDAFLHLRQDPADSTLAKEWHELATGREKRFNKHLHSLRDLSGYHLRSFKEEGEAFGKVSDFVLDAGSWHVLDLVVNSHRWLPFGKQVTCSPLLVSGIQTEVQLIDVAQSKDTLLSREEFDFSHYGPRFRSHVVEHLQGFVP